MSVLKGLVENRYALLGLVVVAMAAIFGVATVSHPAGGAGTGSGKQANRAPVMSAVKACPAPQADGHPDKTGIGAVLAAGGRSGATAKVRTVGKSGGGQNRPKARLRGAGAGWFDGSTRSPVVVDAEGSSAGALTADVFDADTGGSGTELASNACTSPATDSWFIGPGPADGSEATLYVNNVDDAPASADLDVYSDAGPIQNVDARGIVVPPHASRSVPLKNTAQGTRLTALHLRSSVGRLSAAVRVRAPHGDGADWLPAASAPGRHQVVPGLPSGSGTRDLLVAAPGNADATVKVIADTSKGSYVPDGDATLQVPAGSVARMPLQTPLAGRPAAIRLSSDRPVTAGLEVKNSGDVAYTAATPALRGRGVAAINRDDSGISSSMVLSAPGRPARASVYSVSGSGAGHRRTVRIASGHSVQVKVGKPPHADSDGYGIVVVPSRGGGPLYAARVMTHSAGGDLITVTPTPSAPSTVPVYPAYSSYDVLTR